MTIDPTQIDPSMPFAEQIALVTAPAAAYVPRVNLSAHVPNPAEPRLHAPAYNITLRDLVTRLRNVGVTVSKSDQYLERHDNALAPIERPRGINVLDATAEEWQTEALAAAAHSAMLAHTADEQLRLREELDDAMKASMAAEADTYLDTLRPQFDHAADLARVLHEAGVSNGFTKPGPKEIATKQDGQITVETIPAPTDLEYVTETYGEKAGEAWKAFIDGNEFAALITGSGLRATLAETLNVGEGHAPHGVGISKQPSAHRHIFEQGRRGEPEWVAWVRMAPDVALIPFRDTGTAA